MFSKVFGIICTQIAGWILEYLKEDRYANGVLCLVLLIGTGLTMLIKPDYRRQKAAKGNREAKMAEA